MGEAVCVDVALGGVVALGEAVCVGVSVRVWVLTGVRVWLGVSVESPHHKDRIDALREVPAGVRFLSLEPLLADLGTLDLRGIDWVIVGGESSRNARPMHPDWVRSLRDQCQAAGVPFFFKQWGEWKPTEDPAVAAARGIPLAECMSFVGKKAAGAMLDGREWREFPEVRHAQD